MPDEPMTSLSTHGYSQPVFACRRDSLFVAGISMTRNADAGVVGKHPLEANAHFGSPVRDYHLPGMKGKSDADSAAVVK